jgi:hypothetical protein
VLQVERHAALAVVVEREHPGAIGLDDPVLKRRVRRAKHVGGQPALEADDLGAEVREVLADERAGRRESHFDYPRAAERAPAARRGRSRCELGHKTPAACNRASSSEPTPASP